MIANHVNFVHTLYVNGPLKWILFSFFSFQCEGLKPVISGPDERWLPQQEVWGNTLKGTQEKYFLIKEVENDKCPH